MSVVYTWIISSMDTKPQEGNLNDVVVAVHWRRSAESMGIYVDVYDIYQCGLPNPADFTAYPDLTYDEVCGWLDAGLDVTEIDTVLAAKLEAKINPPIVNLPLPWE
jgi:hypothetical protein